MSKILLVDDDKFISNSLSYFLEMEKFNVEVASTAKEAKAKLRQTEYELILLDITLPDESGYEVFNWLKREGINTHVVFLSALDDEINIVRGLEIGAEDYISKPFKPRELLARIKKIIKKNSIGVITEYKDIKVNANLMKVYKDDAELFLSVIEYQLFMLFIQNKDRILERQLILKSIWDSNESFVNDNTLTVTIRRLRKKLEDIGSSVSIVTVRGIGYILQ